MGAEAGTGADATVGAGTATTAGTDAAALLARAEAAGVTFVKGADFYLPGSGGGAGSARLAFSFASVDEIGEGVSVLASLL